MEIPASSLFHHAIRQRLAKILVFGPHSKKADILGGLNPTLKLCRLVGFFPVTTAKNKIGYHWFSLPSVWHLTCFVFCIYLSLLDFTFLTAQGILYGVEQAASNFTSTAGLAATQDESGDTGLIQFLWGYFLPPYLGTIIAIILRIFLNIVFLAVFIQGRRSARGAPRFLKKLAECFNITFGTSDRRHNAMKKIRSQTVISLALCAMTVLVSTITLAVWITSVKVPEETSPVVYTGSMLFQLWFSCHIVLSSFTSAIILTVRVLIEDINDQLRQLLLCNNTNSCETVVALSAKTREANTLKCSHPQAENCQEFYEKFARLKLVHFTLDDIMHRRSFHFSELVQIEITIAIIHILNALIVAMDPVLVLHWKSTFEVSYHFWFAFKIIWDAAQMNEEVKDPYNYNFTVLYLILTYQNFFFFAGQENKSNIVFNKRSAPAISVPCRS